MRRRSRSIQIMGTLVVVAALSNQLPSSPQCAAADHWAFRAVTPRTAPTIKHSADVRTLIDAFLLAALERKNLQFAPAADRATLLRRLKFDLTGLPPTPQEIEQFTADSRPDAYSRVVERLLASPHYGERWGKYWLDVAGYADSNGYFNADSDRPFAYRYRDYVIRAFNADKPFDQFVREQLAGDELSGYAPGREITPAMVELLTATHFLRNGQDGTGESDGNPDELRVDRATALQGTLQIAMNSLLGITIQCCRCHDHKFEPIKQTEFYGLQSVFYPAFPAYDPQHWVKPKDRFTELLNAKERAAWDARTKQLEVREKSAQLDFAAWAEKNRPADAVLFQDNFNTPGRLADRWSNTAPGDDGPGGEPPVKLDSPVAPGAIRENGTLAIISGGISGDRWLVTRDAFNWTPAREGEWIQASFRLIARRLKGTKPADRIGFYLAAHDFNDSSPVAGGNILFDGNPRGGAAVHVDYPGSDARVAGEIGKSGYRPGHRYGVRVTNVGAGKFRLEQIVDHIVESSAVTLDRADLPRGAFGFAYWGARSFIVDDVLIETCGKPEYRHAYEAREKTLRQTLATIETARQAQPGRWACVTDLVSTPPPLHVLKRGNYDDLGESVAPAGLAVLCNGASALRVVAPASGSHSTGRRLAFAHWLTDRDSRASALLARVMVNRIWQRHFGQGLVATPDNFGLSGSPPSHPELLETLANAFRNSGWSVKAIHRLIVRSAAYQQSSSAREAGLAADPNDRLLWRYPLQRLDAEAMRDAMLAVSREISERLYGPYVPSVRKEDGSVVVLPSEPGVHRRAIYLQQRRTQVNTFLELFDAPVIVNNCPVRGNSTVPLQSLELLNSEFVRGRASAFATAVRKPSGQPRSQLVRRALFVSFGRNPTEAEEQASIRFLNEQTRSPSRTKRGSDEAWNDLCQMLLASNAFLYLE